MFKIYFSNSGLDSKAQKLESPKVEAKADKVAQKEDAPNALSNLNQEQLQALLQKAAQPKESKGARKLETQPEVATDDKNAKISQGLEQMLGARTLQKG